MYSFMFRRYKTNTLADGGSIRSESVTTDYLKMAQNNRMDKSIRFGWLGEAGSKITSGRVEKAYSLYPNYQITRRNLLTYTEEFDNAFWFKASSGNPQPTIAPNISSSPLGLLNADKITQNAVSIVGDYSAIYLPTSSFSGNHTFSIYIKGVLGGEKTYIFFVSNNVYYSALCNLTTSWQRFQITVPLSNISFLHIGNDLRTGTGNIHTSSVACEFYIWGAQLEAGSVATDYQRVIEVTSWDGSLKDATQTTAGSRPYITGNIAPNEKLGLKNPNGGSNFMTHPTISFAANEAWSVTICVLDNFKGSSNSLFGNISAGGSVSFRTSDYPGNNVYFIENTIVGSNTTFSNSLSSVGKITILTLVAENNTFSLYKNGILMSSSSGKNTTFSFNSILLGYGTRYFNGQIKAHIIRSQALTQQQVTAEYNYLRSVYPEIESVVIGTQEWATSNCEMAATPQGNVIQEMQAAGNVEKITNNECILGKPNFSANFSTYVWNSATQDATVTAINSDSYLYKVSILTTGKYYKMTFKAKSSNSTKNFRTGITGTIIKLINPNLLTTYQDYTFVFKATQPDFYYIGINNVVAGEEFTIDNVYISEYGWAGSQELYDIVYEQTAGTVEQKTYAAVKAAGFWCHYNNSVDNGAIYGKLYNWFAVKLLQMDIDKYNTDNPTALWGWRVPTQADFQTLSTYLGGDAVSGGKLKLAGTTYWNSPNTGADNSSGFSAVGAGYRNDNGSVSALKYDSVLWAITEIANNGSSRYLPQGIFTQDINYGKAMGNSLRFIKA